VPFERAVAEAVAVVVVEVDPEELDPLGPSASVQDVLEARERAADVVEDAVEEHEQIALVT
jgi:hypothetical protein